MWVYYIKVSYYRTGYLDWSLHIYSDGWAKGDSEIISEIVDDQYTFSGLPNMNPIDKANFKMFWVEFRSNVENSLIFVFFLEY